MLIRFGYVVHFDDLIINRYIHTRALEGDGEKPSRHENEGAFLIFVMLLLVYDGRKPKARIAEIIKLKSIENFQNLLKSRNAFVQMLATRINKLPLSFEYSKRKLMSCLCC